MNKTEKILIRKTKTLFKEYKLYAQHFEKENENFQEKKNKIAEELKKGGDLEKFKSEMEFVLFTFNIKNKDLKKLASDFLMCHSLSSSAELTENFEKDLNTLAEKLKQNVKETFFIPTEKGLEEKVKGEVEKEVEKIKTSPLYKKTLDRLQQDLQE